MFKSLGKKDLEFFDDKTFDPYTKIYMTVFAASLKHVRASAISLLGLVSPFSIELLPLEERVNIVLYSLSPDELDVRTKLANRYLSEIFPSIRLLQGNHLKNVFLTGKLIQYQEEKFWAYRNHLYALYEPPMSYRQINQFINWYMKKYRQKGDIKLRFAFFTPQTLLLTKKKQKEKGIFDESAIISSFEERLAQSNEFRGLELFAMINESYRAEFTEESLDKAYRFVQEGIYYSFLKEADSVLRIRTLYPSEESTQLPMKQGFNLLLSLLTPGFLDQTIQLAKKPSFNVLRTQKSLISSRAKKISSESILNLAVILRTGAERHVLIDSTVIGIERLVLLNLVLQPSHSSQEICQENPEGRIYGPYPVPGFSKYKVFAFKALKSNINILIWLITLEKQLSRLLEAYESIEWFLINWVRNFDFQEPINLKGLTADLNSFLEQTFPDDLVWLKI
ncbi:MAG: hypothetical protein ACFFC7_18320 [Candidatus Hermodarchaeota archaeon]